VARSQSGPVRIGLGGLGSIGSKAAQLLADYRPGAEIVGAATQDAKDIGRPLHAVVGSKVHGPIVVGSLAEMLRARPEVVILATGSFVLDSLPQVLECVNAGAHVISPCEQLAYPYAQFQEAADTIHKAAVANNVTVIGTGINPGLIFDSLVAMVSGVCWDIESIKGRRVVDVTGFGENIHRRLGIGFTPSEFEKGRRTKEIAGHVGFPESIQIVCERLGINLDGPVRETLEPMVSATPATAKYGILPAGVIEGLVQRAVGMVGGAEFMTLELVLHVRPKAAGFVVADRFEINGRHSVQLTMEPGLDPVPMTAAQLVNSIPTVLASSPGLLTVKDIPAPAAWLGPISDEMLR
jgi:2,4-diaminopentanoate dehydrogenase